MFTKEERQVIYDLSDDFTPQQIADRIGAEKNSVYAYLRSIKIDPLTNGDIVKNKLYKEAHLYTREEMFERVDIGKPTFDKYVLECGIKFKEIEQKERAHRIKKSFNEIRKLYELMEAIKESNENVTHPHFKDKYTQSHSPYGIADEVKEILIEIV